MSKVGEENRPPGAPRIPGCTDLVLVRSGIPQTYRGQDQASGEAVSVLVYPVHVDSGTSAAFLNQAKVLAGISHPNVARVRDAGFVDHQPYLVTASDVGTLTDQLRLQPWLPAQVAELGRDLAAGLVAVHGAGIIHGGLAPNAVAVDRDGRAILTGFTLGLGQHTGHELLNSPRQLYLSPETLRDGTVTAASDLYAVGAVLHAAATGQPPLTARMGETPGEHILRVLHDQPARIETLPTEMADAIDQLLAKDPTQRPAGAAAVAATFSRFAHDHRPAAPAPDPPATHQPATAPLPRAAAGPVPMRGDAPKADGARRPSTTTPALPRPALMARNRLRSWPATPQAPVLDQPEPIHASLAEGQTPLAAALPDATTVTGASGAAGQLAHTSQTPPMFDPGPASPQAGMPTTTPSWPGQPDTTATTDRPARRRRLTIVSLAGAAILAGVIVALASHSSGDHATAQTSPAPPRPSPRLSVTLSPPADHDTFVTLRWRGDPNLEYAVVVAQPGKQAQVMLVQRRTSDTVAVVPGIPYCFSIQATNGVLTTETAPEPIRGAHCAK